MRSTVMFMLTCLRCKVKHLICLYFAPFLWFSCTVWGLTGFSIPSFGETVSELRINICIVKHKWSWVVYNILAKAYLVLLLSQSFGWASSLWLPLRSPNWLMLECSKKSGFFILRLADIIGSCCVLWIKQNPFKILVILFITWYPPFQFPVLTNESKLFLGYIEISVYPEQI